MGFSGRKYLGKVNWKRDSIAIALWVSLNLADLIVTIVTMKALDGGFVEGNLIAAWFGENIAGLVGYKIALTIAAIFLLSWGRQLKILQWLNILMAAVVGWNLALLCIFR
jgi:hypothetical protein